MKRRKLARLAASLFFAAFAAGAVAPCVMAALSCAGMMAHDCPKPADSAPLTCEVASLVDCQLPDTGLTGATAVTALAPPPVALALLPHEHAQAPGLPPHRRARTAAGLPPPPDQLRNAVLLI